MKASLDRVEAALKAAGFAIKRVENLKGEVQKKTAEDFVRGVPTNGVALFYYIGLGAHVERLGKHYNLLRPAGETIANDGDYRKWGLDLSKLIELRQKECGARTLLIFADACWTSPIKPESKAVRGGLRSFETPPGVVVAFGGHTSKPCRCGKTLSPHADGGGFGGKYFATGWFSTGNHRGLDQGNARLDVRRPGARDRQTP